MENNKVFLAFNNTDLNVRAVENVSKTTKPLTNYKRVQHAIEEDSLFREIIDECEENFDYQLISYPEIIVKSVSMKDRI